MKPTTYLIFLVGFIFPILESIFSSAPADAAHVIGTVSDSLASSQVGIFTSTVFFLFHTTCRFFIALKISSFFWQPLFPNLFRYTSSRSAFLLVTVAIDILFESYFLSFSHLLTPCHALITTFFLALFAGLFSKREIKSDATKALEVSIILFSVFSICRFFKYVEYDSLVYHLYLPAQWIQHHGIVHIPILFGDQAAAYAPRLGELFFLQWMLPFSILRSGPVDRFAAVGQIPFYLFILYYSFHFITEFTVNKMESLRRFLVFGLLFTCPMILLQAFSASVDLVFATFMYIAYSTLMISAHSSETNIKNETFFLSIISMALALETKFLGLIYLPVYLALLYSIKTTSWISDKRKFGLFIIICIVILGPTYIFNWIQYGSPIFPARLEAFGIGIFHGAYSSNQMMNNPFHFSKFSSFLQILLRQTSITLFIGLLGVLLLNTKSKLNQRLGTESGILAVRSVIRMALVATALIVAHFYFVPYNTEVRFLSIAITISALSIALAIPIRHLALVTALVAFSFLVSIRTTHRDAYTDSLNKLHSWAESTDGPIAYTGFNTAFVLFGSNLQHPIRYVSINRFDSFAFHDFLELFEKSGQTQMLTSAKPNLERLIEEEGAWIENLTKSKISYVVSGRLHPNERAYMHADHEGFPVEYGWMLSKPSLFKPVFETGDHRVFQFSNERAL